VDFGGTVGLLKDEHPDVVMESERVIADLYPDRAEVDCQFQFHNTGKAQTVLMGFPDERGDEALHHFRAYLDGQRLAVRRVRGASLRPGRPVRGPDWYTKRVYFAAGQRRLVRDTYWQGYNEALPRTGRDHQFIYLLWTGRPWKGPIGTADIIVRLHLGPDQRAFNAVIYLWSNGGRQDGHLAPTERSAARLSWHLENYEPAQGQGVAVEWREGWLVQFGKPLASFA